MAQLRVTLKKGVTGEQWRARRVVRGLGLTRVNQSRTLPDNDAVRGMIRRVPHLVGFEPLIEPTPAADPTGTVEEQA